jgi:hypothetical protein
VPEGRAKYTYSWQVHQQLSTHLQHPQAGRILIIVQVLQVLHQPEESAVLEVMMQDMGIIVGVIMAVMVVHQDNLAVVTYMVG